MSKWVKQSRLKEIFDELDKMLFISDDQKMNVRVLISGAYDIGHTQGQQDVLKKEMNKIRSHQALVDLSQGIKKNRTSNN